MSQQSPLSEVIRVAVASACCGDCPRASDGRTARLVLAALGKAMPSPAMQRAIMGLDASTTLTGAQSIEAIGRYRKMLEVAHD